MSAGQIIGGVVACAVIFSVGRSTAPTHTIVKVPPPKIETVTHTVPHKIYIKTYEGLPIECRNVISELRQFNALVDPADADMSRVDDALQAIQVARVTNTQIYKARNVILHSGINFNELAETAQTVLPSLKDDLVTCNQKGS